jgi:hypothetical protein
MEKSLILSRIVLGVFTDPLPSNRRPIVPCVGSRGNVFTESLPSNGSIRHNINKRKYRDYYWTRKNTWETDVQQS